MKTTCLLLLVLATAFTASAQQNEIQEYLEKVKQGRAGQNPQDMAAAKAGDPYAQARILYRTTTNQINDDLTNRRITKEAAALRSEAAAASHERELASIEQRELMEEQNRKLDEVQRKIDQQNEALRLQKYRLQEMQKDRTQQQQLNRLRSTR